RRPGPSSSTSHRAAHLPDSSSSSRNVDGSSSSSNSSCSRDSSSSPWWTWAGPLSSALEYVEGRHSLALGHFVNHPGEGQSPNVLEASLDIPVNELLGPTTSTTTTTTRTIISATASTASTTAPGPRPWLRAYLPVVQPPLHYDPYGKDAEDGNDEDDEEEGETESNGNVDDEVARTRGSDGKSKGHIVTSPPGAAEDGAGAAAEKAGKAAPSAVAAVACDSEQQRQQQWRQRQRLPGELRAEELLSPPGEKVRLLVLVATRALRDGEELLQNYRMNPNVTRPEWYVVHDAEAEQRRWAKVKALDLGFRSRPSGRSGGGKEGAGGAGGF
ncbi:hypothetical protein Vretifemale_16784, partial [Volvox reticuliferus]